MHHPRSPIRSHFVFPEDKCPENDDKAPRLADLITNPIPFDLHLPPLLGSHPVRPRFTSLNSRKAGRTEAQAESESKTIRLTVPSFRKCSSTVTWSSSALPPTLVGDLRSYWCDFEEFGSNSASVPAHQTQSQKSKPQSQTLKQARSLINLNVNLMPRRKPKVNKPLPPTPPSPPTPTPIADRFATHWYFRS
ncbi:hypothetical protein V5O48_008056 [Marasmius crinis-equi]|uniref:Uncharacterized protein n=1 Tax=Marasmius crinis-equi TaxID=585013 RepID=A0ABR3FFP0_9AGAR